jgi:hypothetical protein
MSLCPTGLGGLRSACSQRAYSVLQPLDICILTNFITVLAMNTGINQILSSKSYCIAYLPIQVCQVDFSDVSLRRGALSRLEHESGLCDANSGKKVDDTNKLIDHNYSLASLRPPKALA